jgi:HNH endonuclease/AP2 domain
VDWTAKVNQWVRAKFSYDPETGIVTNLDTGEEAGCFDEDTGYRSICFSHALLREQGYERYTVGTHRLAWFLHHGEWPEVIDHENHVCDDNRLSNLKNVDTIKNAQNRFKMVGYAGKPCHSLHKGVTLHKRSQRWMVRIQVNGKRLHLGEFDSQEEASAAYQTAAEEHFGEHRLKA